jgi:hypothetical protein
MGARKNSTVLQMLLLDKGNKNKMLLRIFSLLVATVSLKDCGSSNDIAQITSFGFDPQTPQPGDETELWVAYNLKEPVSGGLASYSYSFNGIPFSPTVEDLCTQTTCPKEIGTYNETSKSTFPSGLSGKIVSKIKWENENKEQIWCVEITMKI